MIRSLTPWAYGPFEVLMHAEMHYLESEDVDRRIAMIGFDNAIEVAITTYLSLRPIQRSERDYEKAVVEGWLSNYHTKIDFFFTECKSRSVTPSAKKSEILWFHDVRNVQYHRGGASIPQRRELEGVREVALEVFSVLFDEVDAQVLLEEHVAATRASPPPPRVVEHDRLIDNEYGMIDVCGRSEYTSGVLYGLDPARYRETALELQSDDEAPASSDRTPQAAP